MSVVLVQVRICKTKAESKEAQDLRNLIPVLTPVQA
jgi:hypothetical protein